ncbi:hypothetical protein ACFE04_002129 [Oxalis oulophora]
MGSLLGFDNEEHLIVPSSSSSDLILLREIARLKQQQQLLLQLNRGGTHIHNQHCSCLSLNMEEEEKEKEKDQGHILSQHFKALSILHRQTPTTRLHTPHSNFERFNQTVRSGSMALLPDDPFIIHNNNNINNNGAAHHLRQADPNYYHHFLIKPSQMEIDSYLIRSMALEQQQQQQQHNRLLNHRIINPPFNINNGNTTTTATAAAAAFRGSGTGVFHPRIVNATPPIPTTSTFTKRKPTGPRIRPERYNTGQWSSSTTNAAMDKQKDTYNHLPSEMGLPRDWTY